MFYEKKTMEKKVFEENMAAIKTNLAKYDVEDSLRVFASVCNIVDRAFLRIDELNDPKMGGAFKREAEHRYKALTERYGVRDRESLIQAMLQELGMSELNAIKLTRGKFEVEQTLKAMLGEIDLES